MVKLFKIHKFTGLLAGAVLLLLAVTGFFLDHDKWQFLYSTTIPYAPKALEEQNSRLFEGYYVDPQNDKRVTVCSKRGIFESFDGGLSFERRFKGICLGIRNGKKGLFAATDDGIYIQLPDAEWRAVSLKGVYVNALSLHEDRIFAAVDKKRLFLIDTDNAKIIKSATVALDKKDLETPITLSRLVRDLHYGRGYFDSEISLFINDYGAIILIWLVLSGFMIWRMIVGKKEAKNTRALIKSHANIFALVSTAPLLVLLVTGVFLDHAQSLSGFMRSVKIPFFFLPPVYGSLKHDIWSVDYDGKIFRVGNRYGVFKSNDLKSWRMENPGFAYRMIRKRATLFVSGMGAPNRIHENGVWKVVPKTPHMFKDIYLKDGKIRYFSSNHPKEPLPRFDDITLYTLLLSIHDGSLFFSWWVWMNDAAAVSLLLLLFTGSARWLAKKRPRTFR